MVANDPDRELVCAAQNGDKMAMERLYRLHCAAVHAYALRCTGDQDRADEVTQETFIRAFRSLQRFAGRSSFRTWLFAIAINRTRTQLKRTGTDTALSDMDVAALPDTRASADAWTRDQLQKALALLPEGYREVMVMHDVLGMDHPEIARTRKTSVGTSKSQLHKARVKIRELLAQRWGRSHERA